MENKEHMHMQGEPNPIERTGVGEGEWLRKIVYVDAIEWHIKFDDGEYIIVRKLRKCGRWKVFRRLDDKLEKVNRLTAPMYIEVVRMWEKIQEIRHKVSELRGG